jgi:hypothetical protein
VLLLAMFFVPLTAVALRTVGFRRWSSFLLKFASQRYPVAPVAPETLKSARRTARMVVVAAEEGLVHGKCLEQSIVLWWFLKRRRLPAELKIGGRRTNKVFEAHAWVELNGIPVNDGDTVYTEYAPFSKDAASLGIEPR